MRLKLAMDSSYFSILDVSVMVAMNRVLCFCNQSKWRCNVQKRNNEECKSKKEVLNKQVDVTIVSGKLRNGVLEF